MDFGTLINVAQTLFAALHSSELKEVWSMLGYKSELDDLTSTVKTVRAVLLEAEAKQEELTDEARLWTGELKDAVYDADDLLDEFVTLVKQKKLMKGGKFSKKLRMFFSRFNHLSVAYNMSEGVNRIKKNLDRITNNHTKFSLNLKPFPCNTKLIRKRRNETCSYVNTTDIIGRDADVKKIVTTLLDSIVGTCVSDQRDVSFLSIVGMGGLGKTALSQLVFNDKTVVKEFPLRLWTCVSDQDQFDVKTILAKILASASRQGLNDSSSLDMVVNQLREEIAGRRFLIVLDDVWTKNRYEWCKLIECLMGGNRGSWVLVTTRSKETANIVGNKHVYELQGLSNEYSWQLFQLVAFEQVLDQENSNSFADLINIGRKIVKQCANVPLAIKVVASQLYGCDKSKWLLIQESGLANLRESDDGIMPQLKLSYDDLESPLKICFSYCALFPKDFDMQKEILISLWIAQGFVEPLEKGQSIEDAAEVYILILLRRCFFQDVEESSLVENEIFSFKLHDLMHDVALEVSKNEICGASSFTGDIDKKVRHVSAMRGNYANYSMCKAHIRTYLHFGSCKSDVVPVDVAQLFALYRRLRALDLSLLNIKFLPASIGKLVHLRHFQLSSNDIEYLPESITDLFNLQTLDLYHCEKLKELPKKFSKLINLRGLKLSFFGSLTFMPSGMSNLTGLYHLNKFVIGEGNLKLKQHVDLEGLKALKNLRGFIKIEIQFPKSGKFANCDGIRDGVYMRDKEQLYGVEFKCKHEGSNVQTGYEEDLLGALQPHTNLKQLAFSGYRGVRFPRWAKDDVLASSLPNLVSLSLHKCSELQDLPSLERLRQLKSLRLKNLPNLEYIEDRHAATSSPASNGKDLSLLPSLEEISFHDLPKLKRWWRKSVNGLLDNSVNSTNDNQQTSSVSLLRLKTLEISRCPEFTCLLYCPNLELLDLVKFSGRLKIIASKGSHELIDEVTSSTSYPSTDYPNLKIVRTDNSAWLRSSLPLEALQSLDCLVIGDNEEVESLTEFEQVFSACSSSLKTLVLFDCPKLRCLSGGLTFLTCLENLYLEGLPITSFAVEKIDGDGEDDEMPWGSLSYSLQYLYVSNCKLLESFPKWLQKLNSLSHLEVEKCSASLYERCQSVTGEDWPNIEHIPHLSIKP